MDKLREQAKTQIIIPNGQERLMLSHLTDRKIEKAYRELFKLRFGFAPVGYWRDALIQEIENIFLVPTFIQKGTKAVVDPGTTLSPTLAGVTAGNWVCSVVAVSRFSTTPAALTVPSGFTAAENAAGVGSQGSYSNNSACFYKENVASGTHTAAYTGFPAGGSAAEGIVFEFSGIATSLSLDSAHNHNGSSTAALTGNTGASGASTSGTPLWIAVNHAENGSNTSGFTTTVASYTTIANTTSNAAGVAWWSGYFLAAANTTQTVTATWTNTSIWTGCIAGFLPAGGAITVINDANFRRLSRGLGFGIVRGGH